MRQFALLWEIILERRTANLIDLDCLQTILNQSVQRSIISVEFHMTYASEVLPLDSPFAIIDGSTCKLNFALSLMY